MLPKNGSIAPPTIVSTTAVAITSFGKPLDTTEHALVDWRLQRTTGGSLHSCRLLPVSKIIESAGVTVSATARDASTASM